MPPNTANLRGAWAVGTAYAAGDVVTYEGYEYECVASSTGNDPAGDSANTYWVLIAGSGGTVDALNRLIGLNESTYTANYGDCIVGTANATITLPTPQIGAKVEVWSNGSSITLTVQPDATSGAKVNGTTSVTVTTQYTKKTFLCDGSNWFAA
jgi:hypothetical protein